MTDGASFWRVRLRSARTCSSFQGTLPGDRLKNAMNMIARLKASRLRSCEARTSFGEARRIANGAKAARYARASRYIVFLCLTAAACSGSAGIGAVSCGIPGGAPPPATQQTPIGQLPPIDVDALLAHTKMLSSDAFEGRAPGTKGEELSVAYLADQFKKLGLKPGNSRRRRRRSSSRRARSSRRSGGKTMSWRGRSMSLRLRASTTRRWSSWVTGSWRPNSTGTTTRAWT